MDLLIELLWERLTTVDSLVFISSSLANQATGWNGKAAGHVEAFLTSADSLIFKESGSWQTPHGKRFDFSNTYRWTRQGDRIRLEHLRFGSERPVYLFDLVPDGLRSLISHSPHVCSEDLYTASLTLSDNEIELNWTVTGPKLNERIEYFYRWSG